MYPDGPRSYTIAISRPLGVCISISQLPGRDQIIDMPKLPVCTHVSLKQICSPVHGDEHDDGVVVTKEKFSSAN